MLKALKVCCIFGLSLFLVGCFDTSDSAHSQPYLQASSSAVSVSPGQPETVTLTNSGTAAATGIAVSLSSGIDATTFSNNCGTSLAAGASCEINLTANINEITAQTGAITIAATGLSLMTIPVHVVLPTFGFSNTNISAPGTFTVEMTNTSDNPAYLTNLTIEQTSGSGIVYTEGLPVNCETLAAGASCSLSMSIAGNAHGQALLTATGNFDTVQQYLTVEVTITATNQDSDVWPNVLLNPNAQAVVQLHNNSGFDVVNPNLTFSAGLGITLNGTCTSLPAGGQCDLTLDADDAPNGHGALSLTGDNLSAPFSLNVTGTSNDVSFTPAAVTSANATRAGLKYVEIDVDNQSGYDISLKQITSSLSNVAVASDSNHEPSPGCAIDGTLANGQTCSFWVTTTDGPDVGVQTGTLSIQYLANGNLLTEALNLNVETDLYYAGIFATTTGANCGGTGIACQSLAKWNGSSWSMVGGTASFGSNVQGLTVGPNGDLYVEIYDNALALPGESGEITTRHFAYWNGAYWTMLNQGDSSVPSIINYLYYNQMWVWVNGVLYFIYPTGSNYNLGSWNPGTTTFSAVIHTFTGLTASQIIFSPTNNQLYVSFQDNGNPPLQYASLENLKGWTTINFPGSYNDVFSMGFADNDHLILAGAFENNTDDAEYFALADKAINNEAAPTYYNSLGDYIDPFVQSNFPADNEGFFYAMDSQTSPNTFELYHAADNVFPGEAVSSSSSTTGFTQSSSAFLTIGSNYYIAGNFSAMDGGTASNCIAKSTDSGDTWGPLQAGVSSNYLAASCGVGGTASNSKARFILISPTLSVSN